ncbi:TonB C-terminal domain-containing protein [Stakelama sp. CBK3Z-3]|uniref:TonB C-terminal domain-containing protein n=1 Tax=Stakelama flava TaxID=2860338 RepID=A0ABS6XHV9_9SPHN|nr:TonB C-terminal domain-containing protein [Stakelama flava]MBW4329479.1 TonB C-terminal domain-containing protein [Stakelama flava]
MNSKIASITRSVSGLALAAVFGTALVAGAVSPAAANGVSDPDWQTTVSHRLSANIHPMSAILAATRDQAGAVVAAHFDADGNYVGNTLEKGTGNHVLDHEAVRAVDAVKYPQLPANLRGTPRTVAMEVFFSDEARQKSGEAMRAVSRKIVAKYNDNRLAAATE